MTGFRVVCIALLATLPLLARSERVAPTADAGAWNAARTRATPSPARPSPGAQEDLREAAEAFFAIWQKAWMDSHGESWESETKRSSARLVRSFSAARWAYRHCHGGGVAIGEPTRSMPKGYAAITGALTAFGVCPSWSLFSDVEGIDEARNIDALIAPKHRPRVVAARNVLLARIDAEFALAPTDPFLTGQRIRFLLDQSGSEPAYADSVERALERCATDAWVCLALRGYVQSRAGHWREADSSFKAVRALMPPVVRCQWEDLSLLLLTDDDPPPERPVCAQSLRFAERYWWLADPLLGDTVNERHVAHYERIVRRVLHEAFATDGRFHWRPDRGSDAVTRMLLRYGWPDASVWGGKSEDLSHSRWLRQWSSDEQPPYTTFEYGRDRIQTGPNRLAIERPFTAPDSAWELTDRHNLSGAEVWWPQEHFRRYRPLLQLPEYQASMLRRSDGARLDVAADLGDATLKPLGEGASALLLTSNAPGQVVRVDDGVASVGTTFRASGLIDTAPTLLGLEVRAAHENGIDARTRFGITPPPTLRSMRAGDVAVSDPVLLDAPTDASDLTLRGEATLDRMLGTTIIRRSERARVGVYWESYGYGAEEPVTVNVRIERREEVGVLKRVGMLLRLAGDPNSTVDISWREPDIARRVRVVPGPVLTHIRTVVLDIAPLADGRYELVVGVARAGQEPVIGRRAFQVAR